MTTERASKPTIDAVNDAIGALSDLLHSLRAHALAAATEAKPSTKKRGRQVSRSGAIRVAKRPARKVGSTSERILDGAARVWRGITGPEESAGDTGVLVATRTRRSARKSKA